MEIIGLLLAPVVLVSFVWLLITGFKKSLPWGFWLLVAPLFIILLSILVIKPNSIISVLLVSLCVFIPAISFAYKYWEEVHKPFLTYIISSVLSLLISVTTLATIGDDTLESLIAQTQQGQLSEENAAERMRALITKIEDSSALTEHEKLTMRTAKNIITQVEKNLASDPDFYKRSSDSEYKQDLARIEAQRKREESIKNLENRLTQRTTAENKPKPKPIKTLPTIKKSEIKDYIGSKVIILTTTQIKHNGKLIGFDEETYSLILEKERKTGKLKFKIHMSDIKTIFLFIDQ